MALKLSNSASDFNQSMTDNHLKSEMGNQDTGNKWGGRAGEGRVGGGRAGGGGEGGGRAGGGGERGGGGGQEGAEIQVEIDREKVTEDCSQYRFSRLKLLQEQIQAQIKVSRRGRLRTGAVEQGARVVREQRSKELGWEGSRGARN